MISGHRYRGGVRVEYVLGGVLCVALLGGMAAVLIKHSGNRSGRRVSAGEVSQVTMPQEPEQSANPRSTGNTPTIISTPLTVDVPKVIEVVAPVETPSSVVVAPPVVDTTVNAPQVTVPVETPPPVVMVPSVVNTTVDTLEVADPTPIETIAPPGQAEMAVVITPEEPQTKKAVDLPMVDISTSALTLLAEDNFDVQAVGSRPTGDGWAFSSAGISVQTPPNDTTKSLQIADTSATDEVWAKRTFNGNYKRVVWRGKIRFSPRAEGVGICLLDGEKSAVISYIKGGYYGFEDSKGGFIKLVEVKADAWYDLIIDADFKTKRCLIELGGRKKILFLKGAGQINCWAAKAGRQTVGTLYVSGVKVEGK